MIDSIRAWLTRPVAVLSLFAGLAVFSGHAFLQTGLALAERWDRDRIRRAADAEAKRPQVLIERYRTRLREVRTALRQRGYNPGPVDAAMGPQTANALRAFQHRQGLAVTGRPDAPTMVALGVER